MNHFYLREKKKIKEEGNRKEKRAWVIYTEREKSALSSGIIFVFLLCDMARMEGVLHKVFGGKKRNFSKNNL